MHEHLSVEFVDVAMIAEDNVAKEEADRISGMAFEGAAHSRSGNSVPSQKGKKSKGARRKPGRRRRGAQIRLLLRQEANKTK
jgi:hypothetical protein